MILVAGQQIYINMSLSKAFLTLVEQIANKLNVAYQSIIYIFIKSINELLDKLDRSAWLINDRIKGTLTLCSPTLISELKPCGS